MQSDLHSCVRRIPNSPGALSRVGERGDNLEAVARHPPHRQVGAASQVEPERSDPADASCFERCLSRSAILLVFFRRSLFVAYFKLSLKV